MDAIVNAPVAEVKPISAEKTRKAGILAWHNAASAEAKAEAVKKFPFLGEVYTLASQILTKK